MKHLILALALVLSQVASAQISFDPDRSDVNDTGYQSTVVTVGTSQVEVKVGGTRDPDRQRVLIYNDSNSTIYYGPSGVTTTGSTRGVPVFKKQLAVIPVGDVAVYAIAGSAGNEVIVQELK